MPDVQREPAAARPLGGGEAAFAIAPPRSGRADARALAILIYVVAGASLILTSVEPMSLTLLGLASLEPSDLGFEIVARLGVSLSVIGLALIGMALAAQKPPTGTGPVWLTGAAFPAGAGALALVIAGAWATGIAVVRPHGGVADGHLFLLGTLLTLLGVVAEELLLRGLLQPVLIRAWGVRAAVLVGALAFTVIHMVGGWGHPVSLLNILLAGIWFGLLAWRSGGLIAPILAHFGYNWTEEMLFGASPNPGIGAFGSILDVDLVGPAIWGGSVEGLNASLAVGIVLTALIIPLAIGRRAISGGKASA